MLHLHFANRFENLTARLLRQLGAAPRGPFEADHLVVPSAAVKRALTLAIADDTGICAHVRFDFLARWLWQQIGRLVPGVAGASPFDAAVLAWRIDRAFGDAAFVAGHPRLAGYLREADEVMRFELAERTAALLEQYVTYRDDMLDAWRRQRPATEVPPGAAARADEAWQAAPADEAWQAAPADEAWQASPADEAWQASPADEAWQASLWRRLAEELGLAALHPAAAFIDALQRTPPAVLAAAGVPAVTHVFALPTMPPLHLELLQQLARAVEIHVYVLNPCREYWFELIEPRRLSHLMLQGHAAGHEVGNRLLAGWGRQTQSHIDLLVDRAGDAAVDDGDFSPNPAPTLLAQVQNAILDLTELEPGAVALAEADRSLELHVCHSLTRELEVLHDHLLGLFATDARRAPGTAALRPADILVVVPDLEAAAPLVDAVFGSAPPERFIPFNVTGRARSRINVPARALLETLALAGSRVSASAVFGWLQQPIVARRFGLDDDALQQVHEWMAASGMRWALDAAHRASFELPPDAHNTLADGFDRLFLGHALPAPCRPALGGRVGAEALPAGRLAAESSLFASRVSAESPLFAGRLAAESSLFAGRLPAGDAEGSGALALGAFWRAVEALAELHAALARPQPPAAWAARLRDTLDTFLAPVDDELDDLRELQDTIRALTDTMRRAGLETTAVSGAVVRHALTQALDDPARGGVPTGAVTIASMGSLRSLPFRVVCMLGLNDGAFPTAKRPPEFDLMALQPRRGDRQRRDDERNLFLDLLLAARDSLYLSHTGRSVRDNAPLPPSVLVSELLETVLPAIAGGAARARLVVEHPLQPFSLDAFSIDADPRVRSFNRELGDALRRSLQAAPTGAGASAALLPHADAGTDIDIGTDADTDDDDDLDPAAAAELPAFFTVPLAPPGPEWHDVSLAQLVDFFRQPNRYLLRRRLGIELPRGADELHDDEPFLPDHDGLRALAQRLLPALLEGATAADVLALARAGTELPGGALGERLLQRELGTLARFAERVRAATGSPVLAPHVTETNWHIEGETWRLRSAFADLRSTGAVRWAHQPLRAGDALETWLHHLALCAAPAGGVAPQTRWLLQDQTLRFAPPADPAAILHGLLALYRRGLQAPIRLFPKSAWAFVESGSLTQANAVWAVSRERPHGEAADPYHRLALRGVAEPLDAEFEALAHAVFGPLRAHLTAET